MSRSPNSYSIYLEVGKRRVFAGGVDWPGWCRRGRDEPGAVQALLDAGPRYSHIVRLAGLTFDPPEGVSSLSIAERLQGNATTDFGAPNVPLSTDVESVGGDELSRLQAILRCCWQAFDEAVREAEGRELRKGPRGGGRDLAEIVAHVLEADVSYLARVGWHMGKVADDDLRERLLHSRQAILDGLAAAARGELPTQGPRGGIRWAPRVFVRRVAWHVLDHAWEIQDKLV